MEAKIHDKNRAAGAATFLSKALIALCVAAPWVWIAAFATLTLAVTLLVGHLPSYSNPDPKQAPQAHWLWLIALYILPAALVSPLLLSAASALRQLMRLAPPPGGWILFNLAGFAAIVALYFTDPFGLVKWFLD